MNLNIFDKPVEDQTIYPDYNPIVVEEPVEPPIAWVVSTQTVLRNDKRETLHTISLHGKGIKAIHGKLTVRVTDTIRENEVNKIIKAHNRSYLLAGIDPFPIKVD